MKRKVPFAGGEFYHVYNRGVDKRRIFSSQVDFDRFLESMVEFNSPDPIGSIYENSFQKQKHRKTQLGGETSKSEERLIDMVAYCLNPNHFHFLLRQVSDKGVEKFMQRLGTGYTMYFNNKNKRSGALFQGTFKSIHVYSNEYLLHLSAYVNLNNRVHQLGGETSKSSWGEYMGRAKVGASFCHTEEVLGQFKNKKEYQVFAENSLAGVLEHRILANEPDFLLE